MTGVLFHAGLRFRLYEISRPGRGGDKGSKPGAGLDAGLAVLLAEFFEGEGGFADAGLGGLVVNLVNVFLDSSDLLLDFCDNCFHCVVV